MSRIRSIHPGFFTDENLVATTMAARLLFLGIGIEADDKGVFEWKPLTLKMRLFPVDPVNVAELLDELLEVGAIKRYELEGRTFGAIHNFRKFQRPKYPNNVHPMPDDLLAFVGLACEIPPKTKPQPERFPQKGEKAAQMERRGEEEGEDISADADSASPDSGDAPPKPADKRTVQYHEVVRVYNEAAMKIGLPACKLPMSDTRRKSVNARIKEHGMDVVIAALRQLPNMSFIGGGRDQWRASLADLMHPEKFARLVEGKYAARNRPNGAESGTAEYRNPILRTQLGRIPDAGPDPDSRRGDVHGSGRPSAIAGPDRST